MEPGLSPMRLSVTIFGTIYLSIAFIAIFYHQPITKDQIEYIPKIISHKMVAKNFSKVPAYANPQHHSSIPPDSQLYILVLDSSYAPQPYHCKAKSLWMDELLSDNFVDGVEMYSPSYWSHADCQLSTIYVQTPTNITAPDISASLLHGALEMSLKRTNASYYLIIGDATYVNPQKAIAAFSSFAQQPSFGNKKSTGACVEERFYFQIHLLEPGIFTTRDVVIRALQEDKIWEVSQRIGIPAREAFGHVSDAVGISAKYSYSSEFLGNEWLNAKNWEQLTKKEFSKLGPCKVPEEYLHLPSGQSGVCISQGAQLNKVAFWSGSNSTDKDWFLSNAQQFLQGIPDSVGFYWDRLHPSLCNLSYDK